MNKLSFIAIVCVLLATACAEPAYYMEDAAKYPEIPEFPAKFRGTYAQGAETLKVTKNSFTIVSSNSDIPKYGQLGVECFLKKHGAYQVVYFEYSAARKYGYFRLRFFNLDDKTLTVKKIKDDSKTIAEIKAMAVSHDVEEDPDGFTDDQYFFRINGDILDKLIAQYLVVEYTLPKID